MALTEDGLVATHQSTDQHTDLSGPLLTSLTGGEPMTEGRHYWEVQVTTSGDGCPSVFIGAVRPGFVGLDHGRSRHCSGVVGRLHSTFYINACSDGRTADWRLLNRSELGDALLSLGMPQAEIDLLRRYDRVMAVRELRAQRSLPNRSSVHSVRVGVLLDLDAGWMRFYRNGERCGPGFTHVAGPLVRAAEVRSQDANYWLRTGSPGKTGVLMTVTAVPGAEATEGAGRTDEPWQPWPHGLE